MANVKFSIVTPSYNQGRYIRDCIESVRSQTGVAWEHLIQDAGSTDETSSALAEFPHLKVVREPDKGMSDGINRGFLRATGDWVMWLNTDDYLLPGALEKVARFAAQHPEADVIYGGWNFVDGEKKFLKRMKMFPFDLGMMIHGGPYIGSTACFFRRKTVIEAGLLLDVNFRQCMDMEYYARLGKAGKVFCHLPDILAEFRLHGDNTSMRHLGKTSMDEIFKRQRQIAEGMAVRRCYGWTPFNEPFADGVTDALLWYFYRVKKVAVKLLHGCYWGRGE